MRSKQSRRGLIHKYANADDVTPPKNRFYILDILLNSDSCFEFICKYHFVLRVFKNDEDLWPSVKQRMFILFFIVNICFLIDTSTVLAIYHKRDQSFDFKRVGFGFVGKGILAVLFICIKILLDFCLSNRLGHKL